MSKSFTSDGKDGWSSEGEERYMCLNKRKIQTLAKAEARAKDQTARARKKIVAYLCPFCDYYHTGRLRADRDVLEYFKLKGNRSVMNRLFNRRGK